MRYFRILLLHFEHVIEHRARSFVWLLVSLFNPLLFILFWQGAIPQGGKIEGWNMSSITTYYFILTIVSASPMAHIEVDVASIDIQEGGLVKYLLKPFSYYWFKFFEEIHYRVLQGVYALIVFAILNLIFGKFVALTGNFQTFSLALVVAVLAYLISFTFKMIIGFAAFWMTDIHSVYHLVDITLLIFAGYIVPLELLSRPLTDIAYFLPFAYMVYFPVVAFQGKLMPFELVNVIGIQLVWLMVFLIGYRLMWKKGVKKFTGVGQ